MNNTHKVLAIFNLALFLGGYRMISKLGAVLGLLTSRLSIAVLVIIVLIPVIWGAILSWKFYQKKNDPEVPKKGWIKVLAVFPFLNLASVLIFILIVIFYN